jgi:hypothetical protein
MASRGPRSGRLADRHISNCPETSYGWRIVPAESLVVWLGAPKTSLPTFGDSVVGAALIWIVRHCQHTKAGLAGVLQAAARLANLMSDD